MYLNVAAGASSRYPGARGLGAVRVAVPRLLVRPRGMRGLGADGVMVVAPPGYGATGGGIYVGNLCFRGGTWTECQPGNPYNFYNPTPAQLAAGPSSSQPALPGLSPAELAAGGYAAGIPLSAAQVALNGGAGPFVLSSSPTEGPAAPWNPALAPAPGSPAASPAAASSAASGSSLIASASTALSQPVTVAGMSFPVWGLVAAGGAALYFFTRGRK
jgi:hypothetical protein